MNIKKQIELIEKLAEICEELSWVIAIPDGQKVPGLIIGTENFVTDVVEIYYGNNYEVYKKSITDDEFKREVPVTTKEVKTKKKIPQCH